MLIRVKYIGSDPRERDFYFVSKDFSRLPSITVKILQKKFKYFNCTIETFIDLLKFLIKLDVLEVEKIILTSKNRSVVCDKNNVKEKMDEMHKKKKK